MEGYENCGASAKTGREGYAPNMATAQKMPTRDRRQRPIAAIARRSLTDTSSVAVRLFPPERIAEIHPDHARPYRAFFFHEQTPVRRSQHQRVPAGAENC